MSAKKVLVDTSVWIEYFRNAESVTAATLDEILDDHEVCVPKIVLAELMQGAKSARELAVIENFFDAFRVIDQSKKVVVVEDHYKSGGLGDAVAAADPIFSPPCPVSSRFHSPVREATLVDAFSS
jgi:predicted nucleic acid-binding protein